jgi:hypothetical protein
MSYLIHRIATVFPQPTRIKNTIGARGLTACGEPTFGCDKKKGGYRLPLGVGQSIGSTLYGSQLGDPDQVCPECFTEADLPRLIQEGWA